eukprot:gene13840-16319_t
MVSSKASAFALVVMCITLSAMCSHAALVPKNLAGPPSEFAQFVLPDPKAVAQTSSSALIQVVFSKSQTTSGLEWIATVPVDTVESFTISIVSNFTSSMTLEGFAPKSAGIKHGSARIIRESEPTITSAPFGIDGMLIPSTSYTWATPAVGEWTIKITACPSLLKNENFAKQVSNSAPSAFVLAQNPSEFQIYTYLQSYNNLFVGKNVPVLAMLTSSAEFLPKNAQPAGYMPSPIKATSVQAQINIVAPDGQSSSVDMHDDGLHSDGEANDGLYGAFLQASEVGNYQTSIVFKGNGPNGDALFRTTQHIIPITSEFLTLTGKAVATQQAESLSILFEVEAASAATPSVRLYSEVYGTNAAGEEVAVAWVGGVANIQKVNNMQVLEAQLNSRWIALANATAPFTVRNTIVSDLTTFVPVYNTTESFAVKMTNVYADVRGAEYNPPLNVITKEMRDGKMPAEMAARVGKSTGNGKLLLIHGYCSTSNPFTFSDFTNAVAFSDLEANRPNDEFAKMVAAFGEEYTDGYSIIGHSQGGVVALHLATYYHSGLDLSASMEGRVIQSVGTPYQGTGLAGTLASIGSAIGIGCSANNDLTLDGAALWLNTIPTDKRELVYYTTTQYQTGGLVNYCNLAANGVLKWPNDGVTDSDHNNLPGAVFANHFKGWCHTIDMKSPPQCSYSENNVAMNDLSVW